MTSKKRLTALVLCVLTLAAAFLTSCGSGINEDNKGAVIDVYLSDGVISFDPAFSLNDDAALKIFGLVYEGLFSLDKNGKVTNALAKSVKIIEKPEDEYYLMQIELKDSKWSDGRSVQAGDFLYAWQRVLEPELNNPAAAGLFDIKNARLVKTGDCSVDDIGVRAVGTTTLQIEFEKKIDYEAFKAVLASPFYVPLRKDIVNKAEDWATTVAIMTFNGPFTVRSFTPNEKLVLERNSYYLRDRDRDALDKYVTPYQLVFHLSEDKTAQLNAYASGTLFLDEDLPLASRSDWAGSVKTTNMMANSAFYFNTTKAPFDKPEVRRALSLALDRDAIAQKIVYASAATGVVTEGVFDTTRGTSFRSVGGDLIASSADIAAAKSLLSSAGVSGGSFTIAIRNSEVDIAIAEAAKAAWSQLGFSVTIKKLKSEKYKTETEYDVYRDLYNIALTTGDFDVILTDMIMISVDAYSTLAQFAVEYSGGALNFEEKKTDPVPHITGYSNDGYNELIQSVYDSTDKAERSALLHQAESTLLADMPVCPVIFYRNAYVASKELTGVNTAYYGYMSLSKMQLKNWQSYITEETEATVE